MFLYMLTCASEQSSSQPRKEKPIVKSLVDVFVAVQYDL
jgi:hypothetical protein